MQQNTLPKESWKNRSLLMNTITDIDVSRELRRATEAALRTSTRVEDKPNKEDIAKELVAILKTTKTEAEAIQAIRKKYNLKEEH